MSTLERFAKCVQAFLTDAAAVGNATARAILFDSRDPDARTLFYYGAMGGTPEMTVKMAGVGSHYAVALRPARTLV